MNMHRAWGWLVVVAGVVGACVEPPELSEAEQDTTCDPRICGFNSPVIDHNGFHELEMTGLVNGQGFKLEGFDQQDPKGPIGARVRYDLRVKNGLLTGTDPTRKLPPIGGQQLVGSHIYISHHGVQYIIRVANVVDLASPDVLKFSVDPATPVETYTLVYLAMSAYPSDSAEWPNLCGPVPHPIPNDRQYKGDLLGMRPGESVLFESDRIEMTTKTLNLYPETNWFNIGCWGHTLSKLYLTRNSIVSQPLFSIRQPERQATLKLLTADYCGTGRAFTVAGQKLVWQGGGMTYLYPPTSLEARWNDHGAMCLDTPRMRTPTTAEGAEMFPAIDAMIRKECTLQTCANHDPSLFDGALRVSGNY